GSGPLQQVSPPPVHGVGAPVPGRHLGRPGPGSVAARRAHHAPVEPAASAAGRGGPVTGVRPCRLVQQAHAALVVHGVPVGALAPLASISGERAVGGWRLARRFQSALFVAGAVAAVVLVLASGSGRWLLSQEPRPEENQLSAATPVRLTRFL